MSQQGENDVSSLGRPTTVRPGFTDAPDRMVGISQAVRHLDEEITDAARSDAKVLITGDSGVGKEVAARLIHRRSRRAHRALLTINCAGVPDSLLESELFGYVRGSFTGAHRDKPGLLEAAKDGTVFLDEVGEMSLRMQALLLRFLETGEIQRVGSDGVTARLDVRVICATNRSLEERIAEGQFRSDLYYRLNVVHLHIPPLRERRQDIPLLIDYFVAKLSRDHRLPAPTISGDVLNRLVAHEWPGNIRQLKNVLERMVVRGSARPVTIADLPVEFCAPAAATAFDQGAALLPSPVEANDLAHQLFDRIVLGGGSFWSVVYDPFDAHDLTRATLRGVIELGLKATHGRYSELTGLFNMDRRDYKRFLNALKKHDCLIPFHPFRAAARQEAPHGVRVA